MSRLDTLHRARPRSLFLRVSLIALGLFTLYAWFGGDIEWRSFLSARRFENLRRFLSVEVIPPPVRGSEQPLFALWDWGIALFAERGARASLVTFAIAMVAILIASLLASMLAPLASGSLATSRPFEQAAARGGPREGAWWVARFMARAVMIVLRAIPEYVLAFLLLAVLGPETAWPAILALALHNAGILGRLGAETLENLDPRPPRALRAIGASRRSLALSSLLPQALGRSLLYFFYRFETCVREASVLGLLGILSLGYWIEDARSKLYYDEMIFFVALGALIVIVADLGSALARGYIRRSSSRRA